MSTYVVRQLASDTIQPRTARYGIQSQAMSSPTGALLLVGLEHNARLIHIGVDLTGVLQTQQTVEASAHNLFAPEGRLQGWAELLLGGMLNGKPLPIGAVRRVQAAKGEGPSVSDLSIPVPASRDWMERARVNPERMLNLTDRHHRSLLGYLAACLVMPADQPADTINDFALRSWHMFIAALIVHVGGTCSTPEAIQLLGIVPGFPRGSTVRASLEQRILGVEKDRILNAEGARDWIEASRLM